MVVQRHKNFLHLFVTTNHTLDRWRNLWQSITDRTAFHVCLSSFDHAIRVFRITDPNRVAFVTYDARVCLLFSTVYILHLDSTLHATYNDIIATHTAFTSQHVIQINSLFSLNTYTFSAQLSVSHYFLTNILHFISPSYSYST